MNSNNVVISRKILYDIMKSSRFETIYEKLNFVKEEIEKRVKN